MEGQETNKLTVKDIMARDVVVAFEDELVIDAARKIFDKNFNGLPVINVNNKVVGILTQYDLVAKGTTIHIPTFIKLLRKIPILRQERPLFKEEIKPIFDLRVRDIMNDEALMVGPDESIDGLARIFAEHHKVNPIPVVNEKNELLGIVSRHDLVKFLVGPSQPAEERARKPVDDQINDFIENFEKRFTLTTKARTKYWFLLSVFFAALGFFIAFAIIIRITVK